MSKLIDAAYTAKLISNKFNIPITDLVDTVAKISGIEEYRYVPISVKKNMCDMYCRFPRECKNQEALDLICELCPINKWS